MWVVPSFRYSRLPPARAVRWSAADSAWAKALAGWDGLKYNPFAGLPWPPFEAVAALFPLATTWPAFRLLFSASPQAAPVRLSSQVLEP